MNREVKKEFSPLLAQNNTKISYDLLISIRLLDNSLTVNSMTQQLADMASRRQANSQSSQLSDKPAMTIQI